MTRRTESKFHHQRRILRDRLHVLLQNIIFICVVCCVFFRFLEVVNRLSAVLTGRGRNCLLFWQQKEKHANYEQYIAYCSTYFFPCIQREEVSDWDGIYVYSCVLSLTDWFSYAHHYSLFVFVPDAFDWILGKHDKHGNGDWDSLILTNILKGRIQGFMRLD